MSDSTHEVRPAAALAGEPQALEGEVGSGGSFSPPASYLQFYRDQSVAPTPSGGLAESGPGGLRAMTNGLAEGAHPGVKKGGKGKRRIGHISGGTLVKTQEPAAGGASGAGGAPPAATGRDGERAFVADRASRLADRTTTDGTTTVRMEDENDAQAAMISAAVTRARAMLDNAIGKIGSPSAVSTALNANFHSTEDKTVAKVQGDLQRIRNAFDGTIPIEVEDEGTARAYVYVIWSDIHLCPPWFADGDADNRARTIIHECSHKYCGTDDKAYHWDTDKYANLSVKDALNNADSYSWFCMDVR